MRPRSLLVAAVGGLIGFAARRVVLARAERVVLGYDDGSSVALPGAAVGGAHLVELAREALEAAGR